jgi:type VI secretion system protein ImpI/type VI secretion system protein
VSLTLVTIRCPDNVAPERREVHGGEFSIGRGEGNQWVIADPERHLSKKHCRVVYNMGEWELHDLSTNGTYLNRASEPIGHGVAQKLHHGDRIRFGLYELEVGIEAEAAALPGGAEFPASDRQSDFMRDPPMPRSDRSFGNASASEPSSTLDTPNSPILPPDFDPRGLNPEPFLGPTQADHAPALESAFRPPAPVAIIPDDWDVDLRGAAKPQTAQPPSLPTPTPAMAKPLTPQPEHAPRADAASGSELLTAFLRGVGLDEASLADPERTLERIGAALRASVNGLRQTLIARASIKDEFRIAQTVIRPAGNNPLKFSLDDDDALLTLLGKGRPGSMPPEEAIAEAFDDLRMHELATVSAMQAAIRALLAQLAPESIERKATSSALQIHPAQKKARAWDTFVQQHKSVTQALLDDFDSVFGKAFARAYEQAIDELTINRKAS